jgi:acetyl esterase
VRVKERFLRTAVRAALSNDWFVRLASRKRSRGRDAELDSQVATVLELQRIARFPKVETLDPVAARAYVEDSLAALDLDQVPMAEVIDTRVTPDIPVRIFVPHDAGPDWIIYFHGGGGVVGSIASSEPVTRHLADRTRCTVASVAYRLGPEDRHPAAVEDAVAAYRGLLARVATGGRIAVAGDSFGGYLSVQVEHAMRRERRPDLQVLIYPVVDFTFQSPSIEVNADGYLLTRDLMVWFRSNYLRSEEERRTASPWFWPDRELAGAAPAIVITAGFDPLVHEGDAWAERLRAAGVTVRHHCETSLIHGFLSMAGAIRAAHVAIDGICGGIVEALRR